jgi:uncharacterized membrane protein
MTAPSVNQLKIWDHVLYLFVLWNVSASDRHATFGLLISHHISHSSSHYAFLEPVKEIKRTPDRNGIAMFLQVKEVAICIIE